MRKLLFSLGVAGALAFSACSSTPPPIHSIFVAPQSVSDLQGTAYLDHPFPSDVRRDASGHVVIDGMFNPSLNITVQRYETVTDGLLDGFSPAAAAYFRFDGELDPASLPASPPDSLSPTSTVQIVDVDPSSPEEGQRKLLQWYWRKDEGMYWLPDTLAVAPAHGYPLRPHTQYAIVVTRAARSVDGGGVVPSADLMEVLGLTAPTDRTAAVRETFGPAIQELSSLGLGPESIAQLTVFTTNNPTRELFKIADTMRSQVPAPTVEPDSWKLVKTTAIANIYEGVYGPSPNYQAGKIPFANLGDGGNFAFDAGGNPIVQGTFTMRFSLVVPLQSACPMPADGYPIVLYAHGTGGDFESVWRESGGAGQTLPNECIAAMGVDQIFHGARPGAPPPTDPNLETDIELLFFNLNNPIAARTNGQQAAIDVIQQARLFTESHATVPVAKPDNTPISATGQEIRFDASKLLFFGHSQGGVNGPLFLAADNQARGGVLSGTGAMITVALLEKTLPTPSVAGAVKTLLGLNGEAYADELNLFHPVINLAQTIVDSTDPLEYMPYIIQHPRHGVHKSIYQTEGIGPDGVGDSYAPPHGIEIASVAMGLPLQSPGVREVEEAPWGGLGDVTVPAGGLSGNLAGGQASGVLAQFPPAAGSDGHFVVFDVAAARTQAAQFIRNLADDPKGRVPALQ